jgi:hypothetical protein
VKLHMSNQSRYPHRALLIETEISPETVSVSKSIVYGFYDQFMEWAIGTGVKVNVILYRTKDDAKFSEQFRLVAEFETETDLANYFLGFSVDNQRLLN